MTKALDRTEIARIAMTEAMHLANATHGAFISVGAPGMELLATSDDLFDSRRLDEGLLQRVPDTGQPVNVVSHDEPSLAALPVALLGIPVIGSGRVAGIIVLVRADHDPFDDRSDEKQVGVQDDDLCDDLCGNFRLDLRRRRRSDDPIRELITVEHGVAHVRARTRTSSPARGIPHRARRVLERPHGWHAYRN